MKLSYGCDPELFVYDTVREMFVSAHDLIPGTKEAPHGVRWGAIQVDGVATEFNIIPAYTKNEFLDYIDWVRNELLSHVRNNLPKAELKAHPTVFFDPEYFSSLPFEARLLGCSPDFDAYTGLENEPPSTDKPMRTGSGHVHIGWTEYADPNDPEHFKTCCELVRALDKTVYEASLKWDKDTTRRTLYGKKGSFRPKFYGLEYRPLSNAYLADRSMKLTGLVYDLVSETTERFFNEI